MNGTDPALAHFSRVLKETVDTGNISRLRGFLSGRELPALGGDQEPADIIRSAIFDLEEPSAFTRRLSGLLASIVSEEINSLAARTPLDAKRRDLLLNVFHLVVDLPAEKALFTALYDLEEELDENFQSFDRLEIPLWQALAYQQVDSTLEETWLSLLRPSEEAWTPGRRALLLTAWRGLLWIPPDPEMQEAGEIIDFDRVDFGLATLSEAVEGHEEAPALLGTALSILAETYPRSAEFWSERLMRQDIRNELHRLVQSSKDHHNRLEKILRKNADFITEIMSKSIQSKDIAAYSVKLNERKRQR